MSDTVVSLIRTITPMIVGAIVSWLLTLGIELDSGAQNGLIIFLTTLISGLYYAVIRVLEPRWPWLGKLLGSAKKPAYTEPEKTETTPATS